MMSSFLYCNGCLCACYRTEPPQLPVHDKVPSDDVSFPVSNTAFCQEQEMKRVYSYCKVPLSYIK